MKNIPHVADKWKGPDGVVFDVTDKVWRGAEAMN